jgi:ankyrin repeat protein
VRSDIDTVRLLLSYGADPSARTRDTFEDTCLHLAVMWGTTQLVKEVLATGIAIDVRDRDGTTPLHHAMKVCDGEVVGILLSAGASAQAIDKVAYNAFHYAARDCRGSAEEIYEIFVALINGGGNPNGLDHDGDDAIRQAIRSNNVPVFRALCRVGAKTGQMGWSGQTWTILHYAAVWGRVELLSALTEMEIDTLDPDLVTSDGDTAADLFGKRLDTSMDLLPCQTRPTEEEIAVFERLVSGMRERYHANRRVEEQEPDQNWEEDPHEDWEETSDEVRYATIGVARPCRKEGATTSLHALYYFGSLTRELPFQNCRYNVGSTLTATIIAVIMPALAERPTLRIISGNLSSLSENGEAEQTMSRTGTYQKGPMKPHICLTNVTNTPILAASSR